MEKTTKKQTAIFYIAKNRGILLIDKISRPINLNFPDDVIDNLEIINKDKLRELIKSFIQEHATLVTKIIIILDKEITFEKDIDADSPIEEAEKIEEFLDIVPFEKILKKIFRSKESVRIVAVNQDICEEFKDIFENENIKVKSIVPFSMIEKLMPSIQKDLDAEVIFSKINTLKQYSLFENSEKKEIKITYTKPEVKNPRFIALISSFVILLIILLVLIFTQVFVSKSKKSTIIVHPARVLQSTPSATLLASPTSSPQ